MIDILRPINEDNRIERILVELDGYLTNRTEFFAIAIQAFEKNPVQGRRRYPKIHDFDTPNGDVLFESTARLTPKDLFYYLDPEMTEEERDAEMRFFASYQGSLRSQRITSFYIALQGLVAAPFTKELAIIANRKISADEMHLLYHDFGMDHTNGIDKLKFYQGDITSILTEKDFTSIMMNDINELYQIVTSFPEERLKNRMFFIRNYFSNMEEDAETPGALVFKYRKEIDALSDITKFGISTAPLTCLEEDHAPTES